MKKRFGFLAMVLIPVFGLPAFADVTGVWRGSGKWTYEGSGTDCAMTIQYQETADALKRLRGVFNCDVVAMKSDALEWKKQGGDLFLDGKKAGTIGEQGFEASEDYGSEGVKVTTKFTIDGQGRGEYLEIWRDKLGRDMYVIRGNFKKVR